MTLKILLTIFLFLITLVYRPLNRRKAIFYWKTPVDSMIPLVRFMILPYLFFLPLEVITPIILFNNPIYLQFITVYLFVKTTSAVFWYLFPNGVKRTKVVGHDVFSKLINYIYQHDGDTNGFPSGHVYGSLIMTHFLAQGIGGNWWYLVGITISLSTILVKQHYVVDIFGGVLWSVVGIIVGKVFF